MDQEQPPVGLESITVSLDKLSLDTIKMGLAALTLNAQKVDSYLTAAINEQVTAAQGESSHNVSRIKK